MLKEESGGAGADGRGNAVERADGADGEVEPASAGGQVGEDDDRQHADGGAADPIENLRRQQGTDSTR